MKKYIALFALLIMFPLGIASAQGMMMWQSATTTDDHTAKEEVEGKEVLGKLQSGAIKCAALSDAQFGTLGEYFMGQMAGDAHVSMNQRITQMMRSDAEEAMHIALGKRLSGCDTSAVFPMQSENFMMPMMGGLPAATSTAQAGWSDYWTSQDRSSPWNDSDNLKHMYGYHYLGMGGFGEILWWVLIIAGVVFLVRRFGHCKGGSCSGKHALDILKERYAKGEIDKAEFESKKKDLS